MNSNTSATGGVLVPPVSTPPLEDTALDAIFQTFIVGLSELPGAMVRPRWQPVVTKQPEPNENWCAFGIMMVESDDNVAFIHNSSADGGLGRDDMYRHEHIEVMLSFYGPNNARYAAQTRDGLSVAQNSEILQNSLIGFTSVDQIRTVPELVNEQWINRRDFTVRFMRQIQRSYAIRNIVSADVTLFEEQYF